MQNTSPKVGIVSLGCAKALVDSERIVTRLTAEGYEITGSYEGADAVNAAQGSALFQKGHT